MGDIGTSLADVAAHLAHYADMVVAVEQVEFVLATAGAASADGGLVCLESRAAEDNNQALRVLVVAGNGSMLFSDELGEVRWRE